LAKNQQQLLAASRMIKASKPLSDCYGNARQWQKLGNDV